MIAEHPTLLRTRAIASVRLAELAYECIAARAPCRELDAKIAAEIFPSIRGLKEAAPGIWINLDGGRVRALRYSASAASASTLIPAGHWIEQKKCGAWHSVRIQAPSISSPATEAAHAIQALAIAAAALRARAQHLSAES